MVLFLNYRVKYSRILDFFFLKKIDQLILKNVIHFLIFLTVRMSLNLRAITVIYKLIKYYKNTYFKVVFHNLK